MNNFEIIGVGKETNRKRKKVYKAESEAIAKLLAEKEGTEVESITLLPPEPPSERQLAYAKSLGINVPESSTRDSVSYLISSKTETLATNEHINYAIKFGVQFSEHEYKSKQAIQSKIASLLGHHSAIYNAELAKWYVHSIARYLTKGNWLTPDKSGIPETVIEEVVQKLTDDNKAFKSFLRQMEFEDHFEMINFGQKTDEDGTFQEGSSRNTAAYKLVSKLLKENLKIDKTEKKPRIKKVQTKTKESNNVATFLGGIVVFLILCYIFI